MALPETDLARIKKWCDSIWPAQMGDQAKVEANSAPTHVTIVEAPSRAEGSAQPAPDSARLDWDMAREPCPQPVAQCRQAVLRGAALRVRDDRAWVA